MGSNFRLVLRLAGIKWVQDGGADERTDRTGSCLRDRIEIKIHDSLNFDEWNFKWDCFVWVGKDLYGDKNRKTTRNCRVRELNAWCRWLSSEEEQSATVRRIGRRIAFTATGSREKIDPFLGPHLVFVSYSRKKLSYFFWTLAMPLRAARVLCIFVREKRYKFNPRLFLFS